MIFVWRDYDPEAMNCVANWLDEDEDGSSMLYIYEIGSKK